MQPHFMQCHETILTICEARNNTKNLTCGHVDSKKEMHRVKYNRRKMLLN